MMSCMAWCEYDSANCIRIMSYNDDWLIFMQDVLSLLKKPVLSITGENGLFIVFRKVKNYSIEI